MGTDLDWDLAAQFQANLTYRMAYGEASRIVEMHGRNFAWGADRTRTVALEARALAADIARRMRVDPEAIRDAVEDALGGRKPRW